jgi:hypothetical protein
MPKYESLNAQTLGFQYKREPCQMFIIMRTGPEQSHDLIACERTTRPAQKLNGYPQINYTRSEVIWRCKQFTIAPCLSLVVQPSSPRAVNNHQVKPHITHAIRIGSYERGFQDESLRWS